MLHIALLMLLNDKIKYLILICTLSFSTLLITQQTSVFFGVMRWIVSVMQNTNVPIWVVDPYVAEATNLHPMMESNLYRVKSVSGIEWALPLYVNALSEKQYSGDYRLTILIGVDSSTLLGVPPSFVKGRLENLWNPKAIAVDSLGLWRMSQSLPKPLDMGDTFSINDHQVKIEGIVEAEPSFTSWSYIYTTFDRAVAIAPPSRKTLYAILVQPKKDVSPEDLVKKIHQETGLKAITRHQFFWETMVWYFKNTGIPFSFGTTILLGIFVGIAVAGQTFYSFVTENLSYFGVLKAMGAKESLIRHMVFLQAFIVGFIGYGIGLGLAILFGLTALASKLLPFFLSWEVCLFTFIMIIAISYFAAALATRKVRTLEASEVFRA
jgi:putative ABC transport system permease protein